MDDDALQPHYSLVGQTGAAGNLLVGYQAAWGAQKRYESRINREDYATLSLAQLRNSPLSDPNRSQSLL